jgi:prepilin-type N-terminal cleavage/methylation domain-containing protein
MRYYQPRGRDPIGFTLIEVLVVVSLIALLISILLPSLQRARAQSLSVVCQANLLQTGRTIQYYQHDSRGYVPANLWSEYDWFVPKRDLWFYKLRRNHLPDPRILICPADPFRSLADYNAVRRQPPQPDLPYMNAAVPSCGYGLNYLLRHMGEPKSFNIERYGPKRPMNTILLAEVGPDHRLDDMPTGVNGTSQPWRDGGRIVWDDGARPWYSGPTWLTTRHYGGINMSTMDGAVQRVRTVEVLRERIRPFYDNCARGDCLFCNYPGWSNIPHYNFAHAKLWWWTGDSPRY